MKLMLNRIPSKLVLKPTPQNKPYNQVQVEFINRSLIFLRYNFKVIRYIYAARVRSGFGLSNLGSSRVSGRSGSDQVGFQVVCSQVVLGFGSFRFGSGWFSDCLISSHLEFRIVQIWVRFGLNLDCLILDHFEF
jgi:hypothetical protein